MSRVHWHGTETWAMKKANLQSGENGAVAYINTDLILVSILK